jgi:hypothetical protein
MKRCRARTCACARRLPRRLPRGADAECVERSTPVCGLMGRRYCGEIHLSQQPPLHPSCASDVHALPPCGQLRRTAGASACAFRLRTRRGGRSSTHIRRSFRCAAPPWSSADELSSLRRGTTRLGDGISNERSVGAHAQAHACKVQDELSRGKYSSGQRSRPRPLGVRPTTSLI